MSLARRRGHEELGLGCDYCLWDGERCETEFDALNACADAFCAANPDDPACE